MESWISFPGPPEAPEPPEPVVQQHVCSRNAPSLPQFSHVGIVHVSESYDRARSVCDVEVWIRAPALARLLAPKFENF